MWKNNPDPHADGVGGSDWRLCAVRGQKIHRHMPPLVRKNMQMVFQDPYASLDPRMSIQRILEEPLRIHERMSAEEKKSRILPLLEQVGLSRDSLKNIPMNFQEDRDRGLPLPELW